MDIEGVAECETCAEEHEQLAEWLKELKGLRLLVNWAVDCDFGYDNIPDLYEKYADEIKDMSYTEGLVYIATKQANQVEPLWICSNCDLYEQVENDYCQYAGECTINCQKCRYSEQKGSEKNDRAIT